MTRDPDVTIVVFGATGDLARRFLFPALDDLFESGRLPASTRVVATGAERSGPSGIERASEYIAADVTSGDLSEIANAVSGPALLYLALPPSLFATTARAIARAGLANERTGWRRLILEKPFGNDLASAEELQRSLRSDWREDQILRMDHFLGADMVHNMVAARTVNRFMHEVWDAASVSQVQITLAETIGLEGRWQYYDGAGALRDVVQNHVMQLFALTAMEPPPRWDPDVVRDHKRLLLEATTLTRAARGQYAGYRNEPNVPPGSTTETYAAVELAVDNDRWRGVPFRLRSGKSLAANRFEVALQLRPPAPDFGGASGGAPGGSEWIVQTLRPDETLSIEASTKEPSLGFRLQPMRLTSPSRLPLPEYAAWGQLLLDAIDGTAGFFVGGDEALTSWRIVQPALDDWAAGGEPTLYDIGSEGPEMPAGFFPSRQGWRPL